MIFIYRKIYHYLLKMTTIDPLIIESYNSIKNVLIMLNNRGYQINKGDKERGGV